MNSKISEIGTSKLWAMFNDEKRICAFFDADIGSEGQLYYCYDEIALELAHSDAGKGLLSDNFSKMSDLQLAACFNGFRLNDDVSMRSFAEQSLSSSCDRLRTAALEYVASSLRSEYLERLTTALKDKSDIVRAAAATWLVRCLSGQPTKLSALMTEMAGDRSEIVRAAALDALD